MNRDKILDTIREKDIRDPLTLQGHFPKEDRWVLRQLLGEVNRERAQAEVEVTVKPTLRRSVKTFDLPAKMAVALDAGFFRPVEISYPDLPVMKPLFRTDGRTYLLLPDIHAGGGPIPTHDPAALDVALSIGHAVGVDEVIIPGDLFDAYSMSRYAKNVAELPSMWVHERNDALRTAATIRANFPKKKITFLPGNHDLRPQIWIGNNAQPLVGAFTLEHLLGIESLNFEVRDTMLFPEHELLIKHGEIVAQEAGQSVAKEMKDAGMSVIMGHVHRLAHINATRMATEVRGKPPMQGVELGCLCSLNPHYKSKERTANWQQGAAILTVYDNGRFHVEPFAIHQGVALFRGQMFTARAMT